MPFSVNADDLNNVFIRNMEMMYQEHRARIERFADSLREETLNDIEVIEIVNSAREVYPGAVVSIEGVRDFCACEDGPNCSAQVWVAVYKPESVDGLLLSKIEETWVVGPLQQWWLRYHSLYDELMEIKKKGRPFTNETRTHINILGTRLDQLWTDFPVCTR